MSSKRITFSHRLLCMVCGLLTASAMLAVPAKRGWQTKTQADGTMIEVQLVGDEFYHYWETRDGKIAIEQKDGRFVIGENVPSPATIQAKRAKALARRQRKDIGVTPNLAPKGVVILANFSDCAMDGSHTAAVFDELCNSTSCTVNQYNDKNYPSAAQYFADQSNGAYRPVFDVFGPVTLSHDVAHYGTDLFGQQEGSDSLAADAVVEACILANSAYTINWADYDSNNDGKIDFVYVIYAGKGQADGGASYTIWPHNWDIYSARHYHNCTYTAEQCVVGGKTINNYACSGELKGTGLCGIGTLCHEFGHVMGLPDLYDTSYGYVDENYLTPGKWDIMDGGSYNGGSHCPPNYDPWQKYFFGWLEPTNLGNTGKNIQIKANGTAGATTYQINASGMQQTATTPGECYYLENRQQQGWDEFVPGTGLLLWKVNFNATVWSENKPNHSDTEGTPLWTVVSAYPGYIGLYKTCVEVDGEGYCTKRVTSDFNTFPGSQNVTSWSGVAGKPLLNIEETDGVISLTYIEPGATAIEDVAEEAAARKMVQDGQMYIIRGEAVYTVTGNRIQ